MELSDIPVSADVVARNVRNGLTTLLHQACMEENPNAERIRILLEQGAKINWKDHSFNYLTPLENLLSHTKDGDNQCIDIGTLARVFLPAILEIVRKGAHMDPKNEVFDHLRPSIKETILEESYWTKANEPEEFVEFVLSLKKNLIQKDWIEDGVSPNCLLCLEKFTMTIRKHHCRACGILCCDSCSSKRLHLVIDPKCVLSDSFSSNRTSSPARSTNSSISTRDSTMSINRSKLGEADRVCDCCFNKLIFECNEWAYQRKATLKSKPLEGAYTSGMINSVMNEAMQAMVARGEKIRHLQQKSEQLVEESREFAAMARELKQSKQRQSLNSR